MKKFLVVILLLYGAYYYASTHFKFEDTLVYAKKHPEAKWAPAVGYYVGMVYYQRGDYERSQQAFTQLLTDFPTCHYAPTALVRLDDSAEYNHDWETAKAALTRYAEEYPKGKDIELVTKKLEILKYQHP